MADIKVGKVTHYYDKIGVAVVTLVGDLKVGDTIKFIRGGEELFEQKVNSIQMEQEKVEEAKEGQTVGLQTDQEVKDGAEVVKVI